MTESVRILMDGVVDYAGLFPPAKLDMPTTVRNYAAYREGPHAPFLGRLVAPVARLAELDAALDALPEPLAPRRLWRVSALTAPAGDRTLESDLTIAHEFNDRRAPESENPDEPGVVIDCIELKAESATAIDKAIEIIPEGLTAFFELPIAEDPRGLVATLAGEPGVGAKVRAGGVTPDAIPTPDHLARFIVACAGGGVPFKATAGLHHPLRAEHRLTYDPNPPRAPMFGFLNVFLAAAYVYTERLTPAECTRLLEEIDPDAFQFTDLGVSWRGRRISADRLARTRESFALSFGSCSFDEPVEDLGKLRLI